MMHLPVLLALLGPLAATVTATNSSSTGPDADGKYWIYGTGIRASFIPYGASVSNLLVRDQWGIERDLVGGFDNASYYGIDRQHPHFGGVPGRYANRIRNSSFEVDGTTYHVLPNENPEPPLYPDGVDTLHGGPHGWDWRNFSVVAHTASSISFSLVDPAGSQGFPGEVEGLVTYALGDHTWQLQMSAAATTARTPIMLSSHVYWNLDGFANNETNTVLNHSLYLPHSGLRVATDSILIPTGDLVANQPGSVNDFWTTPKQLGANFSSPALRGNCGFNCTGYDTCYLVSREAGTYDWRDSLVARLQSPWSGIQLDVFSDQQAFQMYSCSGQNGSLALKRTQGLFGDDAPFPRTIPQYGCVVLEVEDWIDGINQPAWGRQDRQVFGPGDAPFELQATYRFSINTTAV
ncbi:aldose 1-epimerase [Grosmannia clavigera kw1407]|uniref:Aldose 1-epimerase n=1 Tax=Grosmannia clavigera (strain kw1407 / UAMH 11150) TaxID=655863 RepID=F0XV07_GROCL|nr:aldose 1-epimerase [Grosmannia clavigera kw1407]EFW98550.1 aldose 1-epimerase [Grosmannia clavigera kw1407]